MLDSYSRQTRIIYRLSRRINNSYIKQRLHLPGVPSLIFEITNHAGGNRVIGNLIDQNKTAGAVTARIGIHNQWQLHFHTDMGDIVHAERIGHFMIHGIDIHAVIDPGNQTLDHARGVFDDIFPPGVKSAL